MQNLLIDGELCLFGPVGMDFIDEGFTSAQVVQALAMVPKGSMLTVRINSPGGFSDEGVAIYNALKARDGKTVTRAEGLAASAASLIFCAGADRIVCRGSLVMIHDPAGFTVGTEDDHAKAMESLSKTAEAMTEIYAETSGRTQEECRADMRAETWLTGKDAVALGYATGTDDAPAEEDDEGELDDDEILAWNYRRLYSHAPERLLALSDKKGWTSCLPKRAMAIANPEQTAVRDANNGSQGASRMTTADTSTPDQVRQQSAAIVALCNREGVGYLAEGFLNNGATLEAATARVREAKTIKDKVATARKSWSQLPENLAEQYIVAGKTGPEAAADLLDRVTALQTRQGETNGNHGAADTADIETIWSKSVAKVNARFDAQHSRAA